MTLIIIKLFILAHLPSGSENFLKYTVLRCRGQINYIQPITVDCFLIVYSILICTPKLMVEKVALF
ncbi:MAG: hypothetical protein NWQ38_05835, partial [Cellulophaga sp.]|nr:hypothetical protein [Cellulophaga sp.]